MVYRLIPLLLLLSGCTSEHILEVGDPPLEGCTWVVTDDRPAVITRADLDRCLGRINFTILTWGDSG